MYGFCQPYASLSPEKLLNVIKCCCFRYETMLCCWRYCPHERPEFVDLVQRLDAVVSESVGMVNDVHLVYMFDVHQTMMAWLPAVVKS